MSRFIESVCFKKANYQLLDFHQRRINLTFKKHFPLYIPFNLESHLPQLDFEETYKVRVLYDNESIDVEFAEYRPRPIKSLRMVEDDDIDYAYKSENRKALEVLYEDRGTADDIVIIKKNRITDGSYFNLAFWDGETWVTPKTPLLNGVKRQFYLSHGVIRESFIAPSDLNYFSKVSLINSMLDLEDVEVDISDIS
ncbi:aminotransferase class IV [Marinoscillum sp. MHG1-6]|uniref:aminotransferase class IV n=1 Tax=Marinoscillum sp. MHG1-6 TaxID=2959627 RepID=UPI0021588A08|nr:aminotransferase class IV [Marinoscillum sp. MHG1-6]